MERYDHRSVEAKWQQLWQREQTFAAPTLAKGKRAYVLDMFPYPSAQGLHVGHPLAYIATDIYARYLRMKGVSVLHPMGWDAFGLPAENYAIKSGVHPRATTLKSIDNFRRQLQSLGFSYDWSREVNTADPAYYKWTQWLFLKLYEKGLAYRKEAPVNWCPQDQTVLANEQVVDGCCERCGATVEQRQMKQWFFKTTAYTEQLLKGLEGLDWPQPIIDMQRNWIGKSEGALVKFYLTHVPGQDDKKHAVEIFTTRLDTIFGATFVVISPELAKKWLDVGWQATDEVKKYVEKSLKGRELERLERAAKEKTGVDTGVKAINPATNEEVPVWVADYVLGSYGTGAIMAVPAHDERDFEFAKKFRLPIRFVIAQQFGERIDGAAPRTGVGVVLVNRQGQILLQSQQQGRGRLYSMPGGGVEDGEDYREAARREVIEETGYTDFEITECLGSFEYNYFSPEWGKKRQLTEILYKAVLRSDTRQKPELTEKEKVLDIQNEWVEPRMALERLYEPKDFCGWAEVPTLMRLVQGMQCYNDYGVLINSGKFDGLTSAAVIPVIAKKIGAELKTQYHLRDWLISRQRYWGAPIPIIYCEACARLRQGFGGQGEWPVPEKDLPVELPDDVDFRPTGESPLARSKSFHNVTCPKCGKPARRESDTMDTFVDSSWYWLRYTDPHNTREAFGKDKVKHWCPVNFYVGGAEHAVLHLMYARFITKALQGIGYVKFSEPFLKLKNQGLILGEDGQKMSKSKGNVVNPDEIVAKFGADTLRLYEMFLGPLEEAKPWNTASIAGVRRFLDRVGNLCSGGTKSTGGATDKFPYWAAKTTKKVTDDIEAFRFNTAIAALMEYTNYLGSVELTDKDKNKARGLLLQLLYPFAPHIASELWETLKFKSQVWEQKWPKYNEAALKAETITIAVQVSGKLRATIEVAAEASEAEVISSAKAEPAVAKYLAGAKIAKTVYVPGRLVNFVVQQ